MPKQKPLKDGYSRGGTIHKTKASAKEIQRKAHSSGVKARVVKVKGGYRIDKKY